MNSRSDAGPMTAVRILAAALIVAGGIALVHSKFTYTEQRTAADVGPVSMTVRTDHQVNVPVWAGVAGLVTGVVLLVGTSRLVRA